MLRRKQSKDKLSAKNIKKLKALKDMGFHIPIETPKSSEPPILRPLIWVERRLEGVLAFLKRLALLEILAIVSNIGILIAIITYVATEKQRRDEVVFTAWQTITNAEGQPGNGGRIKALEFLNASPGANWRRRSMCLWLCTWPPERLDGISLASSEDSAGVYLEGINLINASLRSADLSNADLSFANISNAVLSSADLSNALLISADLSNAVLSSADLSNTVLWYADLSNAVLRYADLSNAFLGDADLSNAFLGDANLNSSFLLAIDLRGTRALSPEQLTTENLSLLCGAALPQYIMDAGIDPNRDCDRMAQALSDRYDGMTLEGAQQIVDEARQKQWDEPTVTPVE